MEAINEVWRSVDGYMNYQVSNIGRVRNISSGKILTPCKCNCGYDRVTLVKDGKNKTYRIHCLVANEFLDKPESTEKLIVDHIDRNKQNNTVLNLRYATHSQNFMNKDKTSKTTSSQYKGVSFDKKSKKFKAYITVDKKVTHIGFFNTEEEAAIAYNEKASELYQDFAKLNNIRND